ncbi:hypothetical protein [Paraglaciecola sp. MB-3u-78]|uniref:hypothetical protein n=1 Tax=Paraglaciecola sp. MB-3u-78 TaxID=2058332 RepID=UPI0012FF3DDB|nr:hypothetical protein [Paraglaciecola sp. MB-3u-78]
MSIWKTRGIMYFDFRKNDVLSYLYSAQYVTELMRECCHEHACSMVVVTHNPQLFHFADNNYRLGHGCLELLP